MWRVSSTWATLIWIFVVAFGEAQEPPSTQSKIEDRTWKECKQIMRERGHSCWNCRDTSQLCKAAAGIANRRKLYSSSPDGRFRYSFSDFENQVIATLFHSKDGQAELQDERSFAAANMNKAYRVFSARLEMGKLRRGFSGYMYDVPIQEVFTTTTTTLARANRNRASKKKNKKKGKKVKNDDPLSLKRESTESEESVGTAESEEDNTFSIENAETDQIVEVADRDPHRAPLLDLNAKGGTTSSTQQKTGESTQAANDKDPRQMSALALSAHRNDTERDKEHAEGLGHGKEQGGRPMREGDDARQASLRDSDANRTQGSFARTPFSTD